MIREILGFFRRERFYTGVFLALLGVYAYAAWVHKTPPPLDPRASAVDEFQEAEKRLYERLGSAGSWEKFHSEKPEAAGIFQALTFFAAGAFSLGLVLNIFLVLNPSFRRRLSLEPESHGFSDWKISMLFKVVILFTASSLLMSVAAGLTHRFLLPDVSLNFFLLLQTTAADFLCFGLILMILRQGGGRARDLGLRVPKGGWLREVGYGIGGYVSVYPAFVIVLVFLIILSNLFAYEPPPHPLVTVFLEEDERAPALVTYSLVIGMVIGPFFEEVFFRGFCYPIFKRRWGRGLATLLTATFFAIIHHNAFAFWPIFVLGIGLTYLYEKRRSLIAPVVLHVLHNSIFIAYFFLAKQMVIQGGG